MPPFRGRPPWRATCPHQIIVEGQDDQMAFDVLAAALRARGENIATFDALSAESQSKIPRLLLEFTLDSSFLELAESITIVVDADDAPATAFATIQSACAEARLPVPDSVGAWEIGAFQGQDRRVRIVVVPPLGNGALEDLVLAGIPEKTRQCVEAYLECAADFGTPKPKQRSKARIQALAATRLHDGYMHLGAALRDGKLPLDHPAMEPLRAILRSLWGTPAGR